MYVCDIEVLIEVELVELVELEVLVVDELVLEVDDDVEEVELVDVVPKTFISSNSLCVKKP